MISILRSPSFAVQMSARSLGFSQLWPVDYSIAHIQRRNIIYVSTIQMDHYSFYSWRNSFWNAICFVFHINICHGIYQSEFRPYVERYIFGRFFCICCGVKVLHYYGTTTNDGQWTPTRKQYQSAPPHQFICTIISIWWVLKVAVTGPTSRLQHQPFTH